MGPQSSKQYKHSYADLVRAEDGLFIILTAIVLFVLLAMVALALDAGNLYRARLSLQNAADAAALGTVNHVTMQGIMQLEEQLAVRGGTVADKKAAFDGLLEPMAVSLARSSMSFTPYGHQGSNTEYNVVVSGDYMPLPGTNPSNPGTALYRYQVTTQRKVDFLIADKIPFIGTESATIRTTAVAERDRANIFLMLDLSNSMRCPRDMNANCDCLEPGSTSVCPSSPNRKFDALVEGVEEFLKLFDLDFDNIVLVLFNYGADSMNFNLGPNNVIDLYGQNPNINITRPISTSDVEKITDILGSVYTPNGNTNICAALMRAYEGVNAAGMDNVAHVLFSDGAPTAAELLLSDAKRNLDLHGEGHHYSHYTIEWVRDERDWGNCSAEKYYAGPSLLLTPENFGFSENGGVPFEDPATPILGPSRCHYESVSPSISKAKPVDECRGLNALSAANDAFDPCVNSLEAHLPGRAGRRYGSVYKGQHLNRWREQYYNCAVELSDLLRELSGTVFTIGLGPQSASFGPGTTTDAYQDIGDNFHRKDVLLARTALDPTYLIDTGYTDSDGEIIEFDYSEYTSGDNKKSFAEWASKGMQYRGKYLPTDDPDELPQLFEKVARKILLRLVQ